MEEHNGTGGILVGVDGSEQSIEALRYAATLATLLETPLHTVTAWTAPPVPGPLPWSPEESARTLLDEVIARAFDGSPPAGLVRRAVGGPAARVLIALSPAHDMLVVGSRGRGGFRGLLLGSVSAACAAHAECPVLIMHGNGGPGRGPESPDETASSEGG